MRTGTAVQRLAERNAIARPCSASTGGTPRAMLRTSLSASSTSTPSRDTSAPPSEPASCSPARPRWIRSATRRCCALSCRSRWIRRRSVSPASAMRARASCTSPSSAPFSTASTVADAAARTSSGSSASASSMTMAAAGRASRAAGTQTCPEPAAGSLERHAVRLAVAPRRGIPVADREARVVERRREAVAPLLGRRPPDEPLHEPPQRVRGEQLRLQQRHQEPERQEDAAAHQRPGERLEPRGVDAQRLARQVVDEEDREEQQRGRGHGDQRPALRPARGTQPAGVHDDHAHGDREPQVGLRRAGPPDDLGGRADLQHVRRTRGHASRQRAPAGEHRGQERPEAEEHEHRGPEERDEHPLRRVLEPSRREGQEQVEGEEHQGSLAHDREIEEQRHVGGLPGVHPGERPEPHQQRPEAAGGAAQPPVQPHEHRRGHEIGAVQAGGERALEVVAGDRQPHRGGGHEHACERDARRDAGPRGAALSRIERERHGDAGGRHRKGRGEPHRR